MAGRLKEVIALGEHVDEVTAWLAALDAEREVLHADIQVSKTSYGGDKATLDAAKHLAGGNDVYVTCAIAVQFPDLRKVVEQVEVLCGSIFRKDNSIPLFVDAFWTGNAKQTEHIVRLYSPMNEGE